MRHCLRSDVPWNWTPCHFLLICGLAEFSVRQAIPSRGWDNCARTRNSSTAQLKLITDWASHMRNKVCSNKPSRSLNKSVNFREARDSDYRGALTYMPFWENEKRQKEI